MDKKLISILVLFFLVFTTFIVMLVFREPITQFTRAKEDTTPSSDQTLIFAWPLTAPADGRTQATVTVFVRSVSGKPVANRIITLTTTLGNVRENSLTSDAEGKAAFALTSPSVGVAQISAMIDNTLPVTKKISVKFE